MVIVARNGGGAMAKIVISYRRSDVPGVALLLYDRLTAHFCPKYGKYAIYMDVKEGKRADDYDLRFNDALKNCAVMLVIMGHNWFGGTTSDHTKIADAEDPVRRELETASRLGIRMLPVLVDGAEMIKAAKLPQALKKLRNVDAAQFRTDRYVDSYAAHLIDDIEALLAKIDGEAPPQDRARENAAGAPSTSPRAPAAGILREIGSWLVRPIPIAALVMASLGGAIGAWHYSKAGVVVIGNGPLDLPGRGWPVPPPGNVGGIERITIAPLHLNNASALSSISFSRGNMAVAGDDGVIRLWNADTFRFERAIHVIPAGATPRRPASVNPPRPYGLHKIAFSATGDVIYSAGLDDKVRVVDPATGQVTLNLEAEPNSNVSLFHSLAAFPNPGDPTYRMRWVAAGGDDGCFRIWDVDAPPKPIWFRLGGGQGDQFFDECQSATKSEQREIETIAYSPKGRDYYAVGNYDGTLGFVRTRFEHGSIPAAHEKPVWGIAFSPTGEYVASAGGDGMIKIWNFTERKLFKELPKLDVPVWSLAWDGQWLLSGDARNFVRLWDTVTGQQSGEPFKGHEKNVVAVTFHPNNKWIVSASEDGMLKVWERDGKSREALITIIAYNDSKNDDYVIIHRDGTFTGPSADVVRYIDMTYAEGPDKGQSLSDKLKKGLYVPPDKFVQKLLAGT